jgi:CheY-like chemotaxis protein/anti-sigma regulatory factor (Ser/Thr protein kinase)
MVHGDPDRLQQVLWNLVSNAVRFTPQNGQVEVRIERVGTLLQIRVCDTGQGIARDFLPHVFERFRQQDGSSRRMQGGLGLGLAIAKELVELHGGTVQADSPGAGQGSTFTVALPVPTLLTEPRHNDPEALAPAPPQTAWAESDRAALNGVRLLVVEDDADSREMLVAIFEHCGAIVSAAASAEEAMEARRRATPDVLICDIGLPGEDGYELLRRMRALDAEDGRRAPALALTAYAGPDARGKALSAGFDLQLSKPVLPAVLVAHAALLAGLRGEP